MKFRWKKILFGFLLLFSFTIIADTFVCEDYSSQQASEHCCVQCCPVHHLVPPTAKILVTKKNSVSQKYFSSITSLHPALTLDRIDRPPIA